MAKIKIISIILFFTITAAYSSEWFEKNRSLSAVFSRRVWTYIERADKEDSAGRWKVADSFLRRAERKVEEVKPFMAETWPNGWPQDDRDALEMLRYATPDAYMYRIIGDYAYSHNRMKESLEYYEKYILHSIVPDTDYMAKMADIFQKEDRMREAKIVYENMYRVIEAKNFHGKKFSLSYLNGRIKNLNLRLKKTNILLFDVLFSNVQDFIKSDFQQIFASEALEMENFSTVKRKDFDRVLSEENLTKEDLQYSEELSKIGKMLNADYILRPSLTLIDSYFIFHIDVFDPLRGIWFENYEYKTQSYMYLSNLVRRFTFQFQGKEIPSVLFLPENELLWSYETDDLVSDFKISSTGNRIIAGCESGTVYVLNERGVVLRRFKITNKIIKVAISPCGKYYSWLALDGIVYFADEVRGLRWSKKVGNYGRALDISRSGRFLVAGINNEVIFKDNRGETFWQETIPQWATVIRITEDSTKVYAGMENGAYWCFSDEGNILWKKTLSSSVTDIKVSSNNYSCAVNKTGKTFVFDSDGNELLSFNAGQEIQYSVFKPEVIELLSGQKGEYVYLLSHDKKQLWEYNLSGKVNFIDVMPDGKYIYTVEGKNIFALKIVWE
jgi:WD40 repeat protein